MTSELGRLIARRIALTGPISVTDFMAEALGHPRLGYYRRARPLGAAGDFTTAPEISQMFGELIGAWLAERWLAMGKPDVTLVELGPGRGTLMADALRATRGVPGFHAALRLHLVETNTTLRAEQQRALAAFDPTWHERFDDVPPGPMLLVANEFFDALPVRQFEKTAHGWRERMVGLAPDGETLMFALAPGATPFARFLPDAAEGAQAEIGEAGRALAAAIGARVKHDGGWALIIDYGYEFGIGRDAAGGARSQRCLRPRAARRDGPQRACRFRRLGGGGAGADLRSGNTGRLPAAAWNPAACGNLEGPCERGPAPRNGRDVGALDRSRPNGQFVPSHGRG